MTNYYEVLGCDKNASYEELKRSYHDKIKKLHPDKTGRECGGEFLIIDKAWKTLRDSNSRREYDMTISKQKMDDTPVYCTVELTEMELDAETGAYRYECRCGGLYVLHSNELTECEKVKVCCDECTFHIVVFNITN